MSVADINSKVASAVTSIEAGEYSAALGKLLAAKALLAATPDTSRQGDGLRWDRSAIDSLISQVQRQIGATTVDGQSARGIRTTRITYKRVDADEDD